MSNKPFSPNFLHRLVTKWRKGRPDKARDRGPRKRTVGTLRRPTECNTVRANHCADAVEEV